MLKPTQVFFITSAALAVIIGGGWYLLREEENQFSGAEATTTLSGAGSFNNAPQIAFETPDYMKPIAFSSDVSAELRAQLDTSLKKKQESLKKNSLDFSAWLSMGAVRKIGGDYAGAAEDWEFILSVTPDNLTANYNLGDLYQNSLKDYPKAEKYYLKVIEKDPHNIETYVNLYTMYRYQYKMDTSAADIITKGLAENPGNERLLYFQQEL